jgi:hypothetical protein
MWNEITIAQYQGLYPILEDKSIDALEKETRAIAFLTGIGTDLLDSMPYVEYLEMRKRYSFLHEGEIKGRAVSKITVNKRKYRIAYDLKQVAVARYAEVKHFASNDFIANLHNLMASIVIPEFEDYNSKRHSFYAEDMKEAKFADCWHTAVFFCKLFAKLIKNIPGFMETQMMREGMSQQEARQHVQILCNAMDGYITSNK